MSGKKSPTKKRLEPQKDQEEETFRQNLLDFLPEEELLRYCSPKAAASRRKVYESRDMIRLLKQYDMQRLMPWGEWLADSKFSFDFWDRAEFRRKSERELRFIRGAMKHGLLSNLIPKRHGIPIQVSGETIFGPEELVALPPETAVKTVDYFYEAHPSTWNGRDFPSAFLHLGNWDLLSDDLLDMILKKKGNGYYSYWGRGQLKQLAISSESNRIFDSLIRCEPELPLDWRRLELTEAGNTSAVEYFASKPDYDVNGRGHMTLPPLWYARNRAVAQALISFGADYSALPLDDKVSLFPRVSALAALLEIDPSIREKISYPEVLIQCRKRRGAEQYWQPVPPEQMQMWRLRHESRQLSSALEYVGFFRHLGLEFPAEVIATAVQDAPDMLAALVSFDYITEVPPNMKLPMGDDFYVWSRHTHKYHSKRLRQGVFELLLTFRRFRLPRDIRLLLLRSIVEGTWKKKAVQLDASL